MRLVAAVSLLAMQSPLLAASQAPATNSAPATTNLTAIAPAEIAAQAEATLANLRASETEAAGEQTVKAIEQQLPAVTEEVGARSEEDARILSHSTSLELFARLQGAWEGLGEELASWNRTLTRRAKQMETSSAHIEQVTKTWELTRGTAQAAHVPQELTQRVEAVLAESQNAGQQVQRQLTRVLALQSRVTEQNARVTEAVAALEQARQELLRHLLVRDTAPLWSNQWRTNSAQNLALQSHHSLNRQDLLPMPSTH